MYSDHPMLRPYKTKQLAYFKQLKKQLEARQTNIESVKLRHDWLQRQKVSNYHNEYDRIKGELSSSVLPIGVSKTRLENRQKELEQMIKDSLN